MKTINLLMPFCGGHYYLHGWAHKPFVLDGYTVATDGRIAVWIPGCHADTEGPQHLGSRIHHLMALHATVFEWIMWPEAGPAVKQPCPQCQGVNALHCDDCCGRGWVTELQPIATPSGILSGHYVRMVAKNLPNPTLGAIKTDGQKPVPFRFSGGGGVIMTQQQIMGYTREDTRERTTT